MNIQPIGYNPAPIIDETHDPRPPYRGNTGGGNTPSPAEDPPPGPPAAGLSPVFATPAGPESASNGFDFGGNLAVAILAGLVLYFITRKG